MSKPGSSAEITMPAAIFEKAVTGFFNTILPEAMRRQTLYYWEPHERAPFAGRELVDRLFESLSSQATATQAAAEIYLAAMFTALEKTEYRGAPLRDFSYIGFKMLEIGAETLKLYPALAEKNIQRLFQKGILVNGAVGGDDCRTAKEWGPSKFFFEGMKFLANAWLSGRRAAATRLEMARIFLTPQTTAKEYFTYHHQSSLQDRALATMRELISSGKEALKAPLSEACATLPFQNLARLHENLQTAGISVDSTRAITDGLINFNLENSNYLLHMERHRPNFIPDLLMLAKGSDKLIADIALRMSAVFEYWHHERAQSVPSDFKRHLVGVYQTFFASETTIGPQTRAAMETLAQAMEDHNRHYAMGGMSKTHENIRALLRPRDNRRLAAAQEEARPS